MAGRSRSNGTRSGAVHRVDELEGYPHGQQDTGESHAGHGQARRHPEPDATGPGGQFRHCCIAAARSRRFDGEMLRNCPARRRGWTGIRSPIWPVWRPARRRKRASAACNNVSIRRASRCSRPRSSSSGVDRRRSIACNSLPPGTEVICPGKTRLAAARRYAACHKGDSVRFAAATAVGVINALVAAQRCGRLRTRQIMWRSSTPLKRP